MNQHRTQPRLSRKPNNHGHWEIRWSEIRKGEWRSRRKSTGTDDYAKAIEALGRFLSLRDASIDQIDRTLEDVWTAYLRSHSIPRGNEKTDTWNMRAPLKAFGDWPATSVSESDVEAYTLRRRKGAYSKSTQISDGTIRREIVALQAVLNWGSRKGMIRGKPIFRFPKPSDGPPKNLWLTEGEQADMLQKIEGESLEVQCFVKLALTYGVRKSAILDLRFGPQIDFLTGVVDFRVPGARETRKRRPTVPMTPSVRKILEDLFQEKGRGANVVRRATVDHVARALEKAGYDWVTPHVFKHTAITQMLRANISIEDVARFTATDPRTIHSVYRHHTTDELLKIAATRGI